VLILPLSKKVGNVKKFYSYLILTIENIGFIYLTKNIIILKVNMICGLNLVFSMAIVFKNKGLGTFLGGKARYVLRGKDF
tara:strand:- start:79 stop:318 length:240 start_codon:yes stop_codon:yes gene_type:complete